MRTPYKFIIASTMLLTIVLSVIYFLGHPVQEEVKFERIRSSSSPKAASEMKKELWDYYHKMLRDPETGQIPYGIRSKELEFAKRLSEEAQHFKKIPASNISWQEAGPHDVGGRTRGLAVDVTNPNVILAGGVSGGIWKSTDKGSTWLLKSDISTILSVTTIAQDPRPGHTHIWYYGSGEFVGNSARDRGGSAMFSGDGIYKSTDNGESWQVLLSTVTLDPTRWTSDFDYVLNIKVNPTNGSVFVATNASGIFRSTDGGDSFTNVLGGVNHHIFSDIAVGSDGTLLAVLSSPFQGVTPTNQPGVYKSTDNGNTWTNITPAGYPSVSMRGVLCIAPSNPGIGYLMLFTGETANDREDVRFYKINIATGISDDRSKNLPDFTALGGIAETQGLIYTQFNYNMLIAVKPDDENFVLIGGTSLFRSTDGFATKPANAKNDWIGGYNVQTFFYPNIWVDFHSFSFDPTDPKKVWIGHDGGLSYASDITNTSFQTFFPWENKNNGYIVTQFYHMAISQTAGDTRIMGGTQDKGTPFFRFHEDVAGQIEDVSSGDGAYSYFGQNFAYTSSQLGRVLRFRYDQQNNPSWNAGWATVTPAGAQNMLFINPFVVDPNNEDVMYYLAGNVIWRNNQLSSIPVGANPTSIGWTKLDNLAVPEGYGMSTLSISTNPQHILYYAASSFTDIPRIYKLSNSTTATSGAVEISIPNAQQGAYIHNIAINPDDANEILVVFSNYNVVSLYHSANGGQSYTVVEGNLGGTQQNPGPSVRAATILPSSSGTLYLVATSVGIFSTTQLDGNNTVWRQEALDVTGNVVVSHIVSRKSDGRIVAGSHGRGAFVGTLDLTGTAIISIASDELDIEVYPGQTKSTSLRITNPGTAQLTYSISASGGESAVSKHSIPELPRSDLHINNKMSPEMVAQTKEQIEFLPCIEDYDKILQPAYPLTEEVLILDDGNNLPDGFLGTGGGMYFYWRNDFQLDKDFDLKKIRFYMATETATTNPLEILVAGSDGSFIFDTTLVFDLSSNGKWYEYQFPHHVLNSLKFTNGQTFTLIVGSLNLNIKYPAGYDVNGLKPGFSHFGYYAYIFGNWVFSGWSNLNLYFPNGAFLVRAVGTSGTGVVNQLPVAIAQVSPNPAGVNEAVTFRGENSYDPDGQITNYLWEFGDGQTSNQMNTTHSYPQSGQYTYRLTVTDNEGATGQTSGQISITDAPSRWTVHPSSGSISAGGFRDIAISFNSEGLAEGNYQGQLNINSNAGDVIVPINIVVSTAVSVDREPAIVYSYKLEQNYPNPFNPTTTISWELASDGMVSLRIFDISGREIASVVDGWFGAGKHNVSFDASNLSSGVYIYRLQAGEYVESRKLVLIK